MYTYLYSATDRDGAKVSARVEAENIGQAKYFLECQGLTGIVFHDGEIGNMVTELFDEKARKNIREAPPELDVELRTAGFWRATWVMIRNLWWGWAALAIWIGYNLYSGASVRNPLIVLGLFAVGVAYLRIPSLLFDQLTGAYNWANWGEVRRWAGVIKAYNKISFIKVPAFWLESRLSCADAAGGDLNGALGRLRSYEQDPSVSRFLYLTALGQVHRAAGNSEKFFEYQLEALEHAPNRADGLIDCGVTAARLFKQTGRARTWLNEAYQYELTRLAEAFASFGMGVVEYQDNNYDKSEFHFLRAVEHARESGPPVHMAPFYSMAKAYFAMIYARTGQRARAEQLRREVEPFLVANREKEMLEDCKKAFS